MTKKSEERKPTIIYKVSTVDTLKAIAPGESATYDCTEAGPYITACSVITRFNQAAGYKEYSIVTNDNGAHYTVSRAK